MYLHKTAVSAECLLTGILKKAKEIARKDSALFATPPLKVFLLEDYSKADFISKAELLEQFAGLDDSDIAVAIKIWAGHSDSVLSDLCNRLINRKLFKIHLRKTPFSEIEMSAIKDEIQHNFKLDSKDLSYYFLQGALVNNAYSTQSDSIGILLKSGEIQDITEAADTLNLKVLSEPVMKYFCCFPKV